MHTIITLIIGVGLILFLLFVGVSMISDSHYNAKLRKQEFGPYEKLKLERERDEALEKIERAEEKVKEAEEKASDIEIIYTEMLADLRAQYNEESDNAQHWLNELESQIAKNEELTEAKIKELEKENKKLRQLTKRAPVKFSLSANYAWDRSVRELYVNGKRKQRLENALSENIEARFLAPVKIEIGETLSVSVEIEPSTNREKEKGAYITTLSSCKCYDFEQALKKRAACKHMFALALHLGLINEQGEFTEKTE